MKSLIITSKRKYNGYTIVELLVAAIILTVAIASIVAVVSKGRTLDISDKHRRQARSIIDGIMEKQFNDKDYNLISSAMNDSYDMPLDPRENVPLPATVSIAVDDDDPDLYVSGSDIPVKKVTISVTWRTEPDNETPETISISKWIAKAR